MEEKHIGSLIAVDCGEKSYYQGKLTAVDASSKNITIANAFKEGRPLGKCVTINSCDIVSLKVLKVPEKKDGVKRSPNVGLQSSPKKSGQQQVQRKEKENSSPAKSMLDVLFGISPANGSGEAVNGKNGRTINNNHYNNTVEKFAMNGETSSKGISETPVFRSFEPQVPHPTVLANISSRKTPNRGCNKKQGPSGIPLLDAINCYEGKKRRFKNNLEDPIDFDLESDFDFAENLKLFEKEDIDEEYYENVEKLKISQNFAHYENIVDDEARVISWTKVKARNPKDGYPESSSSGCGGGGSSISQKSARIFLESINFEKSHCGQPIPAISMQQKMEFLKACSESLGEAVFDVVMADRLFGWITSIQERFGDDKGTCVLLASSKNSVRFVRRILTNLDKRAYNCHLFGKFPGEEFENVNVVSSMKELPRSPIVCLLSQEYNDDVKCWMRQQTDSHFVCVESVPDVVDPAKIHLLMYGCATSGLRHVAKKLVVGRTCFEQLCEANNSTIAVDSAIADVGNPSNWFDCNSKPFIANAFSTTFLVHLASS